MSDGCGHDPSDRGLYSSPDWIVSGGFGQISSAVAGKPNLGAKMNSIWASVSKQYYKALSKMREVDGWIGEAVEQHRKSEVVIVSAAAMVTFMAFTFFILQTINAVAGSGY